MLDPEIAALMNQTVWWSPPVGKTDHGDSVYTAPLLSAPARVEYKVEFIRTSAEGEEVNSTRQVLTQARIPDGSMVWVDAASLGDVEQGNILKSCATMTDELGDVSHYEVLI